MKLKLIDFDGIFDKKIAEYIGKNPSKHTEDEWSDVIADLYQKFGDAEIRAIGTTPNKYYSGATDEELVELLKEHLKSDVPPSDFLIKEMEKRGASEAFLSLFDGGDEELLSYAVAVCGSDVRAYDKYLDIISDENVSEDLRDEASDMIKENADPAKDRLLKMAEDGVATDFALDLMSHVKERDERIFNKLLSEFLSNTDAIPKYAHLLSSYGDERYLPYLEEEIRRQDINYIDFLELKYAIEKLGGEYNEERDFSSDPYYIQIHGANGDVGENFQKAFAAETDNNGKIS